MSVTDSWLLFVFFLYWRPFENFASCPCHGIHVDKVRVSQTWKPRAWFGLPQWLSFRPLRMFWWFLQQPHDAELLHIIWFCRVLFRFWPRRHMIFYSRSVFHHNRSEVLHTCSLVSRFDFDWTILKLKAREKILTIYILVLLDLFRRLMIFFKETSNVTIFTKSEEIFNFFQQPTVRRKSNCKLVSSMISWGFPKNQFISFLIEMGLFILRAYN